MMIFIEGFDKYGPTGFSGTALDTALLQEWTAVVNPGRSLIAGLSATGQALQVGSTSAGLSKTLSASYTTFYVGWRFQTNLTSQCGLTFSSTGTAGISIDVNALGQLEVRSGNISGTVKGASSTTVTSGSIHYIEAAITMSTSGAGAATVYLDGVAVITLTGQTFATASINQLILAASSTITAAFDDLYFFDNTGSTNNNVLLSNPRIETEFPSADSAVAFTPTAGILGININFDNSSSAPGANKLALRKFIPQVNCTINSIGVLFGATSATGKNKGVIYTDSTGAPNTLLSSGTEVVGTTSGAAALLPLVTPQALSAGTTYWIGFITDTSINIFRTDSALSGESANNTYTSGAPGTAPAMTTGLQSWTIWGNLTGMAANWAQEDTVPAQGALSYNSSSTVSQEDLFTAPALSTTPSAIYGVQISGNCARSDTGTRTVSLRMKSGSSDSGGSLTGQTPGTSFVWLSSIFETDPNTGAAWTSSALNAAKIGYKIDS